MISIAQKLSCGRNSCLKIASVYNIYADDVCDSHFPDYVLVSLKVSNYSCQYHCPLTYSLASAPALVLLIAKLSIYSTPRFQLNYARQRLANHRPIVRANSVAMVK